jgi:excinuclease ABC subunit A
VELFFDERLMVPDAALSLEDGALAPWRKGKSPYFLQTIEAIAKHYGFDPKAKWKDLPETVQQVFLRGSGDEEIQFRYDEGGRVYQVKRTFEGVIPNMERRYRETDSAWIREEFERYQNNRPCGTCGGYRLRPEALAVKIGGHSCMWARSCRCRSARRSPGAKACPPSSASRRTRSPARSSRKSANGSGS